MTQIVAVVYTGKCLRSTKGAMTTRTLHLTVSLSSLRPDLQDKREVKHMRAGRLRAGIGRPREGSSPRTSESLMVLVGA